MGFTMRDYGAHDPISNPVYVSSSIIHGVLYMYVVHSLGETIG